MDTKTVLLCGGPADGQRVDVLATATTYVWTETNRGGPLFPGQLLPPSMPTYTHTLYKLSVALTRTGQRIWVGFPADYTNDQADQAVTKALLTEESHKDWPRNFTREQYAVYTDQRTRTTQENAVAFPTITAATTDLDRRRAEAVKALRATTGLPLAQIIPIYDRAVQDVKAHLSPVGSADRPLNVDDLRRAITSGRSYLVNYLSRVLHVSPVAVEVVYNAIAEQIGAAFGPEPQVDESLVHMTIKSRNPDKWRFLDLETGETWRWDTAKDAFVKVTY